MASSDQGSGGGGVGGGVGEGVGEGVGVEEVSVRPAASPWSGEPSGGRLGSEHNKLRSVQRGTHNTCHRKFLRLRGLLVLISVVDGCGPASLNVAPTAVRCGLEVFDESLKRARP